MSMEDMNGANIPLCAPEPVHCPGPQSEQAGSVPACAGCPNQNICRNNVQVPDPDLPLIQERLSSIRHKIIVLSGKGGVGKSTIASQLAFSLALDDTKCGDNVLQVGLLDIDICGPSIPRIMGLLDQNIHQSNLGWEPVYVHDNLAVMSVGFLLDNNDDAIIWRGPKKNGLIKQFLRDVYWSDLDYLIIDTPPGTSDEHLSITSFLRPSGITGAIIVTTPQEVSLADVRKEINFCKKVNIPILAVIENMSGFVCPKCGHCTDIFAPTTGGAIKMCQDMDIPFVGSIPLDPLVAKSCDEGQFHLAQVPDSPTSQQLKKIFRTILQTIEHGSPNK